jgi:NAD(P)H-dependent flavin oxidoreductase YrpB (nitropropane dioxygenase family)
MHLSTPLTRLLNIQHPVIMGGMTGVGTPELAAAVSNAGGLGIFAIHNAGSVENAKLWIEKMKTLTNKPWGCNLTILPTIGTPPPYKEYAQAMIEGGVRIIETAGSNPAEWIAAFKQAGIITIHKCVTIRHAISAQKLGVDIISLDGFECAGHPGEGDVGNFVLQAKGANVLSTPFVCSGGVADGKQLAASLALGASGVNLGTRFCATEESNWPPSYKQAVVNASEEDTVLLFRALKNTTRVFANKIAKEAATIEWEKGKALQFSDLMDLVSGKRGRQAERDNDKDAGIWAAGQTVGLITDIPSVQVLMDRFILEACDTIATRLNGLLVKTG